MNAFTLIALGLLAGAGFVWREVRRAPLMPPDYDTDQPLRNDRRVDVNPNPDADVQSEAATREQLFEKLRREEARQRPWEGRN